MKTMRTHKKRLFCLAAVLCFALFLFLWQLHAKGILLPRTVTVTEVTFGKLDGVNYSLWKDRGDTKMTVKGSERYICEWDE